MRGLVAILIVMAVCITVALVAQPDDRSKEQALDFTYRSDTLFRQLPPRQISYFGGSGNGNKKFQPLNIELNTADSAALVRVYGVGPVFASRIIGLRNVLGGFWSVDQLREVRGITDEVFRKISDNFWVDSSKIKKININFAPLNVLVVHPYITPSMARRIERGRMEGGFFNNRKELLDKNILLPQEARRAAPYLSFENN